MLEKLREATRELHEKIEEDNLAGLIMNHSISIDEYKLLLLQNYIAYFVTENAIASHMPGYLPAKHIQLQKDLDNLQVDTSVVREYQNAFSCENYPEALGAAYVVEGSAMGGMLIARELPNCQKLKVLNTHHFFSGDRGNVKSWNNFMKQLKATEFSEEEEEKAVVKACETFDFFGKVFSLNKLPE